MTELQAAIEAAGLPAPETLSEHFAEWDAGFYVLYHLKAREFIAGRDIPDGWETVYAKTAAEACARVKEWMDG